MPSDKKPYERRHLADRRSADPVLRREDGGIERRRNIRRVADMIRLGRHTYDRHAPDFASFDRRKSRQR